MLIPRSSFARLAALGRLHWLPVLLLCALAVALMWDSIRGEIFLPLDIVPHLHPWRFSYERVPVNNPANSDIVQQVYPRRLLTNTMLRQGAWPLWNPTILTGTPLLADGQMAVFYPPSLLLVLLPLARAFGYYALLQEILAGIGCYLFGRQLKLARGPATIIGVCYMLSGYTLTWLQFPHHSGAMAMLPWCFWAVERAATRGRPGNWLIAAIVLCMPLLIQIQLAFYIYVGVGCYVLAKLVESRAWQARLRLAGGFGAALALALALSAVQLIPQVVLSSQGQRVEQVSEQGSAQAQFMALLRLGLPLIGGAPRDAPPAWGAPLLQAPLPYAGLAPLALAVVALFRSRHRASTIFGLLAIGSFALAVSSPLVPLFIVLVPPYRQFTDHSRWFLLWGFAIAVLAGIGAQTLAAGRGSLTDAARRRRWANRLLLASLALFLSGWAWQHLALFTPASRYGMYFSLIYEQPWPAALLFGVGGLGAIGLLALRSMPRTLGWGLLLTVIVGDLLWYGGGYNTSTNPALFEPTTDLLAALPEDAMEQRGQLLYPPTRQIAFLQSQPQPFRFHGGDYPVLIPNLAAAFGLEDIRGYQSLYLARYNRLVRLIDGKDFAELASEGGASIRPYLTSAYKHRRLLDMLNVEFLLFPPGSTNPLLYEPLELVQQDDEGTIYRNPTALPRAWIVHNVEVVPGDEAQLARLAHPDFDPATVALLPIDPPPLARSTSPDRIAALRYAPNQLTVHATAASAGLLVVSDAYTEDWQVVVDGQPAPLYRANYALRGVWLDAGSHEVRFIYRPRSFLIGGVISLIACFVVLLGALRSWWQRAVSSDVPL